MTPAGLILIWMLILRCASRCGRRRRWPQGKRVLILSSFSRDFALFSAVSLDFRTELAQQSAVPIEFLEASLETTLGHQVGHAVD
jgi:hypothetical protein